MSEAFITGSFAYGKPRGGSDVDLVILTNHSDASLLSHLADDGYAVCQDYPPDSYSLRFGRLNLIVCCDKKLYECWAKGTNQLIDETYDLERRNPFQAVSRERAVEVLSGLRREAGFGHDGVNNE